VFRTVLVANRGEIAVRVIRSLRELGVRTVAIYSDADRDARHVELADAAHRIGPPPASKSYLNIEAILAVAAAERAEAVHPGYGFLSENAEFAAACESRGIVFIGPTPANIARTGNKLGARATLAAAGIPVIPGSQEPLQDLARARRVCRELGYPVMLKAAAGGGGRGMRRLQDEADLIEEFAMAQAEARAGFGDPTLYVEKLITGARHIEVQVLGDGRGQGVHLFERNCSVQRRNQKIIEEAPCPTLPPEVAAALHAAAVAAVAVLRYRSAGTLEFLVDDRNRFYFMEMNARIQVEHPVTEAITGIDLVAAQVVLAATGRLPFRQDAVVARGHAIECRINAEDPDLQFMPQPGRIERLRLPGGFGVRVDSHLYEGYTVPVYYDSLLGKVIAHGATREVALGVMRRALDEVDCAPLKTTAPFLRRVVDQQPFRAGTYSLEFLRLLLPDPDREQLENGVEEGSG
jgi:acetyl-CoA carboxylase biotin carboxylase subunit